MPASIEKSEMTAVSFFIVSFRCRWFIDGRRSDDHPENRGRRQSANSSGAGGVVRGRTAHESNDVRSATCAPGPKSFHSRCPNSAGHGCNMAGRQTGWRCPVLAQQLE